MCTAILKKMCNFAASNQIVSNMKKYLFGAVALVAGSLVACNQANEKKPLMKNNGEIADLVEKWLKGHNL